MKRKRILLIEDDETLSQTICNLLNEEFRLDTAHNAEKSIKLIDKNVYGLYLIDIKLPDKNGRTGLDICKYIRINKKTAPILIITGKNAINYKLGAFKFGADDYLCKPFNFLELRARIKALLKRTEKIDWVVLKAHDLHLEKETRTVKRSGKQINLRKREFELLEYFLSNSGRVFSRDSLIQNIWQNNQEINHNTVDVHIKNLRDKIDKPFSKKLIKTVYGIGYKLE